MAQYGEGVLSCFKSSKLSIKIHKNKHGWKPELGANDGKETLIQICTSIPHICSAVIDWKQ